MDSEDIVKWRLKNKWPFRYLCLHAASKKLAWPPKPVLQLFKKKKNPEHVTQNTLYFVTYFGNVFW